MTNGAGGDLWIAQVSVSEKDTIETFLVINGGGHVVGDASTLGEADVIKKRIADEISGSSSGSALLRHPEENLEAEHLKNGFSIVSRPEPTLNKGNQVIDKKKVKKFFVINSANQVVGKAFESFEEARKWAQRHGDDDEMDRQVPPKRFQP